MLAFALASATPALAVEWDIGLKPFLELHCYDCHGEGAKKGGLAMDELSNKLNDPAVFAKWERIYDRALNGEMPPMKIKDRPQADELKKLRLQLEPSLASAHERSKGTVLRRLNRREYENTMNDLFGTDLKLEGMLPEDGRSHEFDVVGEALGVSMTHLQRYLDAAGQVFDAAVAKTTEAPKPELIDCAYRESEVKREAGKTLKRLEDGALVRFSPSGLSGGHLREGGTRRPGTYRVRVTGYAYQSDKPVAVSISGVSYAAGSGTPQIGFASFPPGKPITVEMEGWLEPRYMLRINPYGLFDAEHYKRAKGGKSINDFKGPGFAFLSASMEGPLVKEFPSRGHKLIFGNLDRLEIEPPNPRDKEKSWYKPKFEIRSENESADAANVIKRLAAFAFRRAVSDDEFAPYLALFKKEREKKESFEGSLRTVFTALFSSPHFLYLREKPGRLDDLALANRLSLFLSRTMPERKLLSLAYQGKLTKDPGALRKETERLLKHDRFDRFLTDFTESWLDLRDMDFTEPDKKLFPEFDRPLQLFMVEETEAFLRELIDSNLPITNLVKSEFAMLNERLAEHYEVPGVTGIQIRKVKLPAGTPRGGFLSQGSVLKVTANGTNTSPVLRGTWVMERILGKTPTPPPPGIPGVEPDVRGAESLRDLLAKHRSMESCRGCHAKFDPLGFALESFNPIGGFRDHYRSLGNTKNPKVDRFVKGRGVQYRQGPKVDASGKFEDGVEFAGFTAFRSHLARQPENLTRALAKKLLTFATGRELGFSDRAEVERIVKESTRNGYRVRDLIHLVVESTIFQSK
ncbi:MAG: DUF1592 domain-containing protein [Opitutae bacterium]|nr:DUF1592 domain-containing protein [Opitutae bacterium]